MYFNWSKLNFAISFYFLSFYLFLFISFLICFYLFYLFVFLFIFVALLAFYSFIESLLLVNKLNQQPMLSQTMMTQSLKWMTWLTNCCFPLLQFARLKYLCFPSQLEGLGRVSIDLNEFAEDGNVLTTSTSSSDLASLSTELLDSRFESFNSVLVSRTVTGEQEGGSRRLDLERKPSVRPT
jgi:hypothetical protein